MKTKTKHKHRWTVVKTIWPYRSGWGVWCPKCHTLLKDGLDTRTAQAIADSENDKKRGKYTRSA